MFFEPTVIPKLMTSCACGSTDLQPPLNLPRVVLRAPAFEEATIPLEPTIPWRVVPSLVVVVTKQAQAEETSVRGSRHRTKT